MDKEDPVCLLQYEKIYFENYLNYDQGITFYFKQKRIAFTLKMMLDEFEN